MNKYILNTSSITTGGTVTCVIALTNSCGGGSVEIWLMHSGKGVGSNTMMD